MIRTFEIKIGDLPLTAVELEEKLDSHRTELLGMGLLHLNVNTTPFRYNSLNTMFNLNPFDVNSFEPLLNRMREHYNELINIMTSVKNTENAIKNHKTYRNTPDNSLEKERATLCNNFMNPIDRRINVLNTICAQIIVTFPFLMQNKMNYLLQVAEKDSSLKEEFYEYKTTVTNNFRDFYKEITEIRYHQQELRDQLQEVKTMKESLIHEKDVFEKEKIQHLEEKEELKKQIEEIRFMRKELKQEKERLELEKLRNELEKEKEKLAEERREILNYNW
jgi:DNA repair exonuclease SbcCD ATPase subunit